MNMTIYALAGLAHAPRSAERRDPLLKLTGTAARRILTSLRSLPVEQRVAELNRVLASVDAGLPDRVRSVAAYLARSGMNADLAVERAVALLLADVNIDRFTAMGEQYRRGAPVQGLGQTTTTPTTPQGQDAAQVAGSVTQGIACSTELRNAIVDLVGRNQGRSAADATTIGLEVGRGIANCQSLQPTVQPLPPPPAPPAESSMMWPLIIGIGSLAVVGGVVFLMRKR
jgi:hypothetical protein